VGVTRAPALGYYSGIAGGVDADLQLGRVVVASRGRVSTADKYVGSGTHLDGAFEVRLYSGRVYVAPGVAAAHSWTSGWQKSALHPTAAVGVQCRRYLAPSIAVLLRDPISPNHGSGFDVRLESLAPLTSRWGIKTRVSVTRLWFTQGNDRLAGNALTLMLGPYRGNRQPAR
jgi:hypothetical protein